MSLPDPPVGKATASKWLKTHHPDLVPVRSERGGAHKFGYYMDVVGWDVPPEFGDGVVGSNLKLLREALERGKTWETLAEGQRIAWWRILGHKMHDCLGMREVVMIAAEGLT